MIQFSPPDIQEEDIEAVVSVLRSGWITSGGVAHELEARLCEFTGAAGAVVLNSCTAALETSLRMLDIGPGDEVIVPAYTYTASASVVEHVGASIVLVDSDATSYSPSVQSYLDAITPRTKAIITVDLGGVPYQVGQLISALDDLNFGRFGGTLGALGRPAVIADAAHSLGAHRDSKMVGEEADFSCFSFHAVKNLTTAEGGALCWSRRLSLSMGRLSDRIRRFALHGQSKDAYAKAQVGSWEYDILELGYKFNMPDILAALGLSQLKRYSSLIERRRQLVASYDERLSDHFSVLRHSGDSYLSSCHLYMVDLNGDEQSRNRVIHLMALEGISTNVHYKPLPMLTAYKNLGFKILDFPNALRHYQKEITLPLHTKLSDGDVTKVSETLLWAMEQARQSTR